MDDQKEALKQIIQNNIFILTGSAGTGKTFIIKKILKSFPESKIVMAAPGSGDGARDQGTGF